MSSALAVGLSDAEVAQRVAEGKTNDVPSQGGAQRRGDRPRQRLHPDQRDPRRAAGHRAVDRVAHQRTVRHPHRRQQRDRHHSGTAGQADTGPSWRSSVRRNRWCAGSLGPARGRRARWCSTTSSSSGPGDQIVVDGEVVEESGPRGRRVAADGRGRPDGQGRRRRGEVGQLRRRGQRGIPGDEGGSRGVRRQARRGGQQVHAGEVRAAQRHQQDPPVHHLPA